MLPDPRVLMPGAIRIHAGQDDKHLYRHAADGLARDGLRSRQAGDAFVIDPASIHAVARPARSL